MSVRSDGTDSVLCGRESHTRAPTGCAASHDVAAPRGYTLIRIAHSPRSHSAQPEMGV